MIETRLISYLKSLRRFVCGRPHPGGPKHVSAGHFDGSFNTSIRSKNGFSATQIERFVSDVDHGLFHSIAVGFAGSILSGEQLTRQSAGDALIHDFLRGATGIERRHDLNLRSEFPNLSGSVYQHSNPCKGDENSPLVLGDRAELMRFPDFSDWVDFTRLPAITDELRVFYKNVRPALSTLWHHRRSCFLGHGPESESDIDFDGDWPNQDFINSDMITASCEIDRPPFSRCGQHGRGYPWGKLRAWRRLRSRDQVCATIPERDHLSMAESIPASECVWIFTNLNASKKNYQNAIAAGMSVVSRRLLNQFFLTASILEDRIYALNLR